MQVSTSGNHPSINMLRALSLCATYIGWVWHLDHVLQTVTVSFGLARNVSYAIPAMYETQGM